MRRPEPWSRRRALGALLAGATAPLVGAAASSPARAGEGLGAWSGFAGPPATLVLSGAALVQEDGRVVEGGLALEQGRVVEVGPGVRGGEDLRGAFLCAGLVDAGTGLGLVEVGLEDATHEDAEASGAVHPDARVVDAYNPLSELIPVARRNGITHAVVEPAGGRLVPGQAGLVRLAGRTVAEAQVLAPLGLCVHLGASGKGGEGGPSSRMGIAMRLRELLDAARPPEQGGGRRRRAADPAQAEKGMALAAWRAVGRGELKVLFHAERAQDLLLAVELARTYALDAVLVGGAEAWLVAPELVQAGLPLLLGPVTQPSSFEHPHARDDVAARLHAAGLPFALRTGAAHSSRDLPILAGLAVAHGLPPEAARRAMTAAAGTVLGVPCLGRLQPGETASFAIWDGDPLQPRSAVRRLWIDGRPARLDSRQTRLHSAFEVLP